MKTKKCKDINEVINSQNDIEKKEKYNEYVDNITPVHNPVKNMIWAFVAGGVVCIIGQGLGDIYKLMGVGEENAKLYSILSLMLISTILTGFGVYAKMAKFAGAGLIVPITGFANSVVSPAIEYKKEGQVFGIGCKIFTIAGPVILYGIVTSWVLGFIYWIVKII